MKKFCFYQYFVPNGTSLNSFVYKKQGRGAPRPYGKIKKSFQVYPPPEFHSFS